EKLTDDLQARLYTGIKPAETIPHLVPTSDAKNVLEAIGRSWFPEKFESACNMSATTLEILMSLPFGREFILGGPKVSASKAQKAYDALNTLQEQINNF